MKLRSGRIVFNDSVEGYIFLNTYCSISKIQNRIIFRNKLKKLIKKWYLWLIKKHNNSNYFVKINDIYDISLSVLYFVPISNKSLYVPFSL